MAATNRKHIEEEPSNDGESSSLRIWTDKGLEIEIVRISTVALAGVDGGDGGHIIDR